MSGAVARVLRQGGLGRGSLAAHGAGLERARAIWLAHGPPSNPAGAASNHKLAHPLTRNRPPVGPCRQLLRARQPARQFVASALQTARAFGGIQGPWGLAAANRAFCSALASFWCLACHSL